MTCPRCGTNNPSNARACMACGADLTGVPQSPESQAPQPPQPAPQQPQYGAYPGAAPGYGAYPPPPPQPSNWMATASLVLGVLGFFTCGLTGLIGLVLALVALRQASRTQASSGLAIGGLVCSIASLLIIPVMAAILFPIFAKARANARQTLCMSNQKQLATAIMVYAQDYDQQLPAAADWTGSIGSYTNNAGYLLRCPAAPRDQSMGYGYNRQLSRLSLVRVGEPALTPMTFDGTPVSATDGGGPESVVYRHADAAVISFADGHARTRNTADVVSGFNWNPVTSGPGGTRSWR